VCGRWEHSINVKHRPYLKLDRGNAICISSLS